MRRGWRRTDDVVLVATFASIIQNGSLALAVLSDVQKRKRLISNYEVSRSRHSMLTGFVKVERVAALGLKNA